MARTYTVQLLKMLLRIVFYSGKRNSQLLTNLTANQYASLQRIVAEINNNWPPSYKEQP